MEEIIQFDKHLLLMLNGSESLFLDELVMTLTNAKTWIPLYIAFFYAVLKNSLNVRQVLMVLACAGLCVLLAGTVDDLIVKPLVARWRPARDPEIGILVDVVNGYRGGKYGFFSAHASNTFSIAIFFSLLFRRKVVTCFLVGWSLINCWTRLYLGVHYPGDIMVGLIWGGLVGYGIFRLYRHYNPQVQTFRERETDIVILVLVLLLLYAVVKAFILTWI